MDDIEACTSSIFSEVSIAERIKKLKDKEEPEARQKRQLYGFQSSNLIPGPEIHEELE
jgi:hypothetical protein